MSDELVGIVGFLLADAGVAGLVSTRVYGAELPDSVAAAVNEDGMPPKCVLVQSVPFTSSLARGNVSAGVTMKDLKCYGETSYEARRVYIACRDALKGMTRVKVAGVSLYAAVPGASADMREPGSNWPLCFSTFELLAAEQGV